MRVATHNGRRDSGRASRTVGLVQKRRKDADAQRPKRWFTKRRGGRREVEAGVELPATLTLPEAAWGLGGVVQGDAGAGESAEN